MSTRKILITGATGKQGGAVIKALLASPPPFDFEILALTRKTSSPAAQALTSPNVTLVEGDLNDCPALFDKLGGNKFVWGVFSVQVPVLGQPKGSPPDIEEKQGMALVDAALANGVSHFVYSSVGSGGPDREQEEERLGLRVPHFVSKYLVEAHLKEKAQGTDMTYTILQPVAFMDNLIPGMIGKGFAAMWMNMGETKLQLVSSVDIGRFAAIAFSNPEGELKNKEITLVGDDLTQKEGDEVFWKTLHRPMPRTYGALASLLQYMIKELGTMFQWFLQIGYKGDVAECRRINPQMLDLGAWLKEESQFKSW